MRQRAFSLPELLAALAILGILATLAMPSWQRHLARMAVDAATRQALAGLALARRTALSSGTAFTFCPTEDLVHCSFEGHEWMLFAAGSGTGLSQRAADSTLLRRWPLPRGVRLGGSRNHVWYLPQTRAAATTTWVLCHPALPAAQRELIVSQTGRVRLGRAADPANPRPCA